MNRNFSDIFRNEIRKRGNNFPDCIWPENVSKDHQMDIYAKHRPRISHIYLLLYLSYKFLKPAQPPQAKSNMKVKKIIYRSH